MSIYDETIVARVAADAKIRRRSTDNFCANGHEWTAANTRTNKHGRFCRACAAQWVAKRYRLDPDARLVANAARKIRRAVTPDVRRVETAKYRAANRDKIMAKRKRRWAEISVDERDLRNRRKREARARRNSFSDLNALVGVNGSTPIHPSVLAKLRKVNP